LASGLEYPSTPQLAARVGARLVGRGRGVSPSAGPRRALAAAVLLLVGLFLALLIASPQVRIAIAERLGLRGVVIVSAPTTPVATVEPAGSPRPTALPTVHTPAG